MRKPKGAPEVASVTPQQPIFVRNPEFKSYYINNVKIAMTSNDFNLICGQVNAAETEGAPTVVDDILSIRLSPQTLKVIVSGLTSAIDGWEKIFGKLPDLPAGTVNNKGIAASLDLLQNKIHKLAEET
jgi:hypothetical protein